MSPTPTATLVSSVHPHYHLLYLCQAGRSRLVGALNKGPQLNPALSCIDDFLPPRCPPRVVSRERQDLRPPDLFMEANVIFLVERLWRVQLVLPLCAFCLLWILLSLAAFSLTCPGAIGWWGPEWLCPSHCRGHCQKQALELVRYGGASYYYLSFLFPQLLPEVPVSGWEEPGP